MISKEYKAIFIHIYKTAGSSIEKKLGLYNELYRNAQDHRRIVDLEKISSKSYRRQRLLNSLVCLKKRQLSKAKQYFKYYLYPELTYKQYKNYFKFTITRNTWSRVSSWYRAIMRDKILLKELNITNKISFYNFIKCKMNHEKFNQLNFIRDSKNDIPLDFIGEFENLHKDFAYVANILKIEDYNLPQLLISDNKHYSNYYDDKTKDLVYKIYKDEIKFFKYEFENNK